MPRPDGDLPPRKGDIFQDKIIDLLCDLQYEEVTRRRFHLDFVADPAPQHVEMLSSGPPTKTFLRPLFSPNGKTAFEFRGGEKLQLAEAARELLGKINAINTDNSIPLKNIVGGVVVKDIKVPLREIKRISKEHGVYVWDTNILCFLASKAMVGKKWEKAGLIAVEERLNDWATVVRCVGTYKNCLKIRSSVFYQNPFEILDLDKVKEVVNLLTKRIQDITRDITLTTYVSLQVHSICGTTEELDKNFHGFVKKQDQGRIKYEPGESFLRGYDIAPWHNFSISFESK
jgi:hypothetical protein